MRIVNGNVFKNNQFEQGDVGIADDRIVSTADAADDVVVDVEGCFVIPGLVDLHFHGCKGKDFCDGTDEALHVLAGYEASRGVTAICPATMTYTEEVLNPIMDAARAFKPSDNDAALVGINMEGPYLSLENIGAQNPLYVHKPDVAMFQRLQERSGGLIKIVDVAPEVEGASEFISTLSPEVRLSIAHTQADFETCSNAIAAGVRHITHLCNAMPPLHHRKPGPIAAAFDKSEVTPEIICDGVHIHPAMVRLLFAAFGEDRMIMVSDSMMAAGMSDGTYALGGQEVTVKGNKAVLKNGTIAGSNTDLMSCVRVAVKEMNLPLETVVKAASVNPARALGLQAERGSLDEGKIADIVILDSDLQVKEVIVRGKRLSLNEQ